MCDETETRFGVDWVCIAEHANEEHYFVPEAIGDAR